MERANEKIEQDKEKPKIQKFEIVVRGLGGPGEILGVRINGKNDPGFLMGISEFFKKVSPEELSAFFPQVFEVLDKEGKKQFKLKGKPKDLLNDEEGLKKLANKLGITVEVLSQGPTSREIRKEEFEHRYIEPKENKKEQ